MAFKLLDMAQQRWRKLSSADGCRSSVLVFVSSMEPSGETQEGTGADGKRRQIMRAYPQHLPMAPLACVRATHGGQAAEGAVSLIALFGDAALDTAKARTGLRLTP